MHRHNTATEQVDPALAAMIGSVLAAYGPSARDTEGRIAFDADLWAQLDKLGLVRLTGSEEEGGSGAGWREAAALLAEAARHAVSLPLAENDLLAGWMLSMSGLPLDDLPRTTAVLDASGAASGVPWAAEVDQVLLLWPSGETWLCADVPTSYVEIQRGWNLAGEPRDDVRVDPATLSGTPIDADLVADLWLRGALARAVQVVGALERILDHTVAHSTSRLQFGRTLSRFQAIQHQVADLAGEVALARAAVDSAVSGSGSLERRRFLVAVARSCVGHAASVVVRGGHQLHGAIGTTREHELHRYTLPALAWRSEFGSPQSWDVEVAKLARKAGATGLWPLVVGPPDKAGGPDVRRLHHN